MQLTQSCLTSSSASLPVIAVCGATGTGKSKLAISLASVFNGEVINFDALQLYGGLNIATNKVSPAECLGIPHHLIGIFPPEDAHKYDVHSYRDICLPLIEDVRSVKKKLAILAGGTHYYLEAVLWQDFLSSKRTTSHTAEKLNSEVSFSNAKESYDLLSALKPSLAAQLHPNNVRKVRKALLDVLSDIYQTEQQVESVKNNEDVDSEKHLLNRSVKPRYPGQSLILWLDCSRDVLNTHLNKRVDMMLASGLISELDDFLMEMKPVNAFSASKCNEIETTNGCNISLSMVFWSPFKMKSDDVKKNRVEKLRSLFSEELEAISDPMVRRGLLRSIGFKEFSDYLALLPSERDSPEAIPLLTEAVKNVKLSTRQYARRQVSWIRNRFLRRPMEGSIPVYRIDVTDFLQSESLEIWNNSVVAPTVRLVYSELMKTNGFHLESLQNIDHLKSLLNICPEDCCPSAEPLLQPKLLFAPDGTQPPFICSICSGKVFTQIDAWQAHLKCKSHQKRAAKQRKRLIIEKSM
ncbi:unnamed protein product [Heterobilharzia americana]|nr:unnamed protein product [Heterobilharzia americana]